MASKYPPFERVTAGKLHVGDNLLIRAGKQDQILWKRVLEPGWWKVVDISSTLHRDGRKAIRVYTLTLVANNTQERQTFLVTFAQRFNRIIKEGS